MAILLIEPDKPLARVYKKALERMGRKVILCYDAQEAIHLVDTKGPELIITELQLAEHNGVEFLYELRSYPDWEKLPVIVLTNIPPGEAGIGEQASKKLHIKKYLYKPQTTLEQLGSVVEETLKQ